METSLLSKNVETNKNWLEVWSVETDGSLKTCVNFYDIAFENAAAWVANCFRLESDRTDDDFVIVHAYRDESNTLARQIINCAADTTPYQSVKKFRNEIIKNN